MNGLVTALLVLYTALQFSNACAEVEIPSRDDAAQNASLSGEDAGTTGDTQELEKEMKEIASKIKGTIGTAACTHSNQCAALAVGVKPCGGYARYLPYSMVDTDVGRLKALSEQYNRLSARRNARRGAISDCMVPPPPMPVCLNGTCQLQNSSPRTLPERR